MVAVEMTVLSADQCITSSFYAKHKSIFKVRPRQQCVEKMRKLDE